MNKMSWLLVPLQYLFSTWRAEKAMAEAFAAAESPKHRSLLKRAQRYQEEVESLQVRFPDVTNKVDGIRQRDALRASGNS